VNVPSRRVWVASVALALSNLVAGLSYVLRPPSVAALNTINTYAGGIPVVGTLLITTAVLILVGWVGRFQVPALVGHGISIGAFTMSAVAISASAWYSGTSWASVGYTLTLALGHFLVAQGIPRRPRTDRRQ
jgi:hypothetical protein